MGYLIQIRVLIYQLIVKKFIFEVVLYFIFLKSKKRIIVQNKEDYSLLKKV